MSLFLDNISLLLMYFIHMLSRLSYVRLSVTLWTVACQAPLSMGFSRQGYWSGLPFPTPGDLADPGIKPTSPSLLCLLWADSLPLSHLGTLLVLILGYVGFSC